MPACCGVSWPRAGLVVLAALVALAPGVATGRPQVVLGAGVVLGGCTLAAALLRGAVPRRSLAALDTVFLILVVGSALAVPPAVTTVVLGVLPAAVLVGLGRLPGRLSCRPAVSWLRWGRRPRRSEIGLVVVGGSLAALALVVWAATVEPTASPYLTALRSSPLPLALLGVIAFAFVNSVWEEVLFRGVILQDLVDSLGAKAAVVAQAVVFGAAHWAGFPSGWTGVAMTAAWGLLLGVLRLRTGGLGAPYLAHVLADATIGLLAISLLTR